MCIYFTLSDWGLSCEYGDYMWIADTWGCSEQYGVRNAEYGSPLGTWRTVEYFLTVVCRALKYVCTGCVVCYYKETLLCPVSQLLFLYFTLWCLPTLLCHVIILFYIVDSWRWMNNESEDWSPSDTHYTFLSLWKKKHMWLFQWWCSFVMGKFRHVVLVIIFHVKSSCKEIGLRICLKGRLLTYLEHGRA